ncbi:DUF6331 family protein [Aquimarina sp. 2201CG14-23]|uniref:DUF6331 family protein n=1 Tax=Aquimarina mycalae TaxID=3040073 RepID=UPI00247810BE|nr:DUF6331 family protein [Aquimarina sp. 2201CG14-23]MDH7447722.1 DUF6331 family protein [Aquimarina sp. 2201CG14-23]
MKTRKESEIINVDQFLESNKDFWQDLETECVAECCGIDAFDFSQENLERTIKFYNSKKILLNINRVIECIENNSSKLVCSSILNHCVSKIRFIELFKNIKQVLLGVSV